MKRISRMQLVVGLLVSAVVFNSIVSARGNYSAAQQSQPASAAVDKRNATGQRVADNKRPLYFEENRGQVEDPARFFARGKGYNVFLTETRATLTTRPAQGAPASLKMEFANANRRPRLEGIDRMPGVTNYFRGNEPAKWLKRVPHFSGVIYHELYSGIDLKFHQGSGEIEYDFVVSPGADPQRIKMDIFGADQISIDAAGDLRMRLGDQEIVQRSPVIYQGTAEARQTIEGKFVMLGDRQVGFAIGEYDRTQTLVIDPVISYLTYIGGSDDKFEEANGIAADTDGNAYVVGITDATDFPDPDSRPSRFGNAVYVAKLDPTGRELMYLTYLDGEANDGRDLTDGDRGGNIAVDANGNAYVTGSTFSDRFPTTPGVFQRNRSFCAMPVNCAFYNNDAFVAKLDSRGQIAYATYLGGRRSDTGNGIAVDGQGRAYVVGDTDSGTSFPLKDEFQSTGFLGFGEDAYLTVFTADGSDIGYSTGLGGRGRDFAAEVGLDSDNNVYVTGQTEADDFPTRNAFQDDLGGGIDAFVAKFDASGRGDETLLYSTYVGGSGTDRAHGIAVTSTGTAFITGVTGSFNYPLRNAIDSTNEVNEAFVTQLSSSGELENSTFVGGRGQETGFDIDTDGLGNIWITGNTTSSDFPSAVPFQEALGSTQDAFVTKLRFTTGFGILGAILGSSFLGGNDNEVGRSVAVQNSRVVYACGSTKSTNLSTTPGVLKGSTNSEDGYVARILDTHRDAVGVFRPTVIFLLTQSISTVVAQSSNAGVSGQLGVAGDWNGDGVKTVGTFTSGVWKYRNFNFIPTLAVPVTTVNFGLAGDIPVAGDWNGDGIDTPGVFRPSSAQFFLTNSTSTTPAVELVMNFGAVNDRPVAGDWNGDGVDSVAVFRSNQATFFFTNENVPQPSINGAAFFGTFGDRPIAGDWNGDGVDTFGVFHPSSAEFQVTDDNVTLLTSFLFGASSDQPIAGDWDGRP